MEFSVCIDSVFRDRDPQTALFGVRESGFEYFEFWGWWNKDIDSLIRKAEELSLTCIGFCTRFIPLTDPGQRDAYLVGLKETIAVAKKFRSRMIITQIGSDTGARREFQHKSVVMGLKACAPILKESGMTMVIEPVNRRYENPNTFCEFSDEAFEILDETGSENVKMLFDTYHQQISEGDIINRSLARIGQIGHFHAAGHPNRYELYDGELNYKKVFAAIEAAGYQGYMGIEHKPAGDPVEGLKRIKEYVNSKRVEVNSK